MKFYGEKELEEKPIDLNNYSFEKPALVYIVGAGASKDAGFPLCNDLKSEEFVTPFLNELSSSAREAFEWMKSQDDNFEVLLAKAMESNEQDRVAGLLTFYEEVFLKSETAAFSSYYNCSYIIELIRYQAGYASAVDFQLVIISFNHDLMLEYAKGQDLKYNYGTLTNNLYGIKDFFPGLDEPGYDYTILKLHGSFNMLSCNKCEKIMSWGDYTWQWKGANCLACKIGIINPLYIPPTPFKDYNPLSVSWEDAKSALRRAQGVYVIGYSLPNYDQHAIKLLKEANKEALLFVIDKYAPTIAPRYSQFPPSQKLMFSASAKEYCESYISGNIDMSKYSHFS